MPVLLEVVERAFWRVNRQVCEIRSAQPLELSVDVGKVATLQQWIIRKINSRYDVLRAERDLLALGKEIVDHPVQHEAADRSERHQLLRNDFGGVEHVEIEAVSEILVEELQPQLPFRIIAILGCVPEVAAVEVGISTVDLQRLVPND